MEGYFSRDFIVRYNRREKASSFSIEEARVWINEEDSVTVESIYSSINYKDIQSCLGNPAITRKFPHRPGMDLVGKVLTEGSQEFVQGDLVFTYTHPLGTNMPGTYGTIVRLPEKFIERVPEGLTPLYVMMLGTAGFTAGLALMHVIDRLRKGENKVMVTGATSATGAFLIMLLNRVGIRPIVLVRGESKDKIRKDLEIGGMMFMEDINAKPLIGMNEEEYDIVFDLMGGDVLTHMLCSLKAAGTVLVIGNVTAGKVVTSLSPFFERGISMLGVSAEKSSKCERKRVWEFISSLVSERDLITLNRVVPFSELGLTMSAYKRGCAPSRPHSVIDFAS